MAWGCDASCGASRRNAVLRVLVRAYCQRTYHNSGFYVAEVISPGIETSKVL